MASVVLLVSPLKPPKAGTNQKKKEEQQSFLWSPKFLLALGFHEGAPIIVFLSGESLVVSSGLLKRYMLPI